MDFLPIKFTLKFFELFVTGLFMISPVLLFLSGIIFLIARFIYKIEKWQNYSKSLYFTFITALTVGYGNTVPSSGRGKFLSVVSAFVGVVLTGVIVSVALNSVMLSWQATHDTPMESSIQATLQRIESSTFSGGSKVNSNLSGLQKADSLSILADSLVHKADSLTLESTSSSD